MAMQAIVHEPSGDNLQLHTAPRPQPGPGQLLLRVHAAGVNRADLLQRAGRYPPPPGASAILGLEVAGEVTALGVGVSEFQPGDAVLGLVAGGGYAEYALLDAGLAWRKPDALSWIEAASLPEAWLTAWLNLIELGQLQAGQRWLIHAGASGVGAAAIQLAKAHGAWVASRCSGAEKIRFCQQLGADQVFDRQKDEDFAALLKNSGGVDGILDCVGGSLAAAHQRCLNSDGRWLLIGLLGGVSAEINLGLLLVKRQQLLGSTLRSLPLARQQTLARCLAAWLLPALASGAARATVDRTFPLAEAAAAHRYLASGANCGKVVLSIA